MSPRRTRATGPWAAAITLFAPLAAADQAPVSIDGALGDWALVPVAYTDAADGGSGVDFGRLWIADDDRFLFLRLEVGAEIDLSENNNLRMFLDTDDSAATGTPVAGIGAELEWRFGERQGTFVAGGSTTVFHEDIRFRAGPTVTATEFEMAFGRDMMPDGQHPLFPGPVVRIVVRDEDGGDQLPEAGEFVTYTMDEAPLPPEPALALLREQPDDLRVITFNVLQDGPWDGDDQPRFERLVTAADPDIICFQEIYDHSPAEAAALVGSWLPGSTWSAVGNTDCKTVTRLPILDSWPVGNELAALIDAQVALGSELLVINAHLPCCSNDSGRQNAADEIMAFVRDARTPGGQLDLSPDAPIVITGDLNLVGLARQLETLLTGDISDEGTYGPDFAPDWDGTDLLDVIAQQTEKRMGYTWRNDWSSFWPGRLDFIIATDSVAEVGNRFILYTPEMSPGERAANGLLADDSYASDHLLLAADLQEPGPACTGDIDGSGTVDVLDFLLLLASWGDPGGPGDVNDDGTVDVLDFLTLLAFWGPC
ncbi:MAG: endonuclease/exonuclease/phosphatase family protein [Planctomycetota bacterium]|jgi:endonuclease/exonuclease/phosphatase family metal-dependent hydrolase